jgi:pimeloyl-ACP methyl ester carboxylesterase
MVTQEAAMATFVLVPGAWLGGWCWRDVAARLAGRGHTAVGVTLSGLGERAHLLSREIGLATHVADVVGLLHWRDLGDVILVGHSYGGTVITAVAGQVPQRLRRLVYLDASVPQDGQSNNDVIGATMTAQLKASADAAGEGWRVPPAAYVVERLPESQRGWVAPRLTPHPWRPFTEPVRLGVEARLPRAFLQTSLQSPLYLRLMAEARAAGWQCRELAGGHYPMFTEPELAAGALAELAG